MAQQKYRVLWHDIGDGHFLPEPDKELFTSTVLEDCKDFKEHYLEQHGLGFYEIHIQKEETVKIWMDI